MSQLQVSAFQMDDNAILTVKDGEVLLVSGVYKAFCAYWPPTPGVTMAVEFGGDVGRLPVVIQTVNDDPVSVGEPARPGQRRVYWSGILTLDYFGPYHVGDQS